MPLQRRHLAVSAIIAGLCALTTLTGFALNDAARPIEQKTVQNERLGPVTVDVPAGEPRAFVFLLSDAGGPDREMQRLTESLVAQGAVVVPLSTPQVLARLDATTPSDCYYALGLFEEISQEAQRALDVSTYRWPVILGVGQGGTLAYLSQAQAPANTSAGAVSIGFEPSLHTRLPLCGQAATKAASGNFDYKPAKNMPGRWIAVADGAGDNGLAGFAGTGSSGEIRPVAGGTHARLLAAEKATFEIADAAAGLEADALPVEELPAKGADTLVVFYSGDGGWRDIDKRISDYLNSRGVAVLGVDSLRYFWRKKEPQTMAGDLDRLIRHYGKQASGNGVMLVGYSFGADIIPFMVNRLSADTKSQIKMVSLLGISEHASFEIRLQDIIGGINKDGPPTLPELLKMKGIPTQCVFGEAEKDSVCADKALDASINRVEMAGGHHFDGDYRHTADLIIGADKTRVSNLK